MSKKKICIVAPEIGSGGVEAVLLNFFSHIDCAKYELSIITYKVSSLYMKKQFEKLGFRIILIPPKKKGLKKSISAMDQVFRDNEFDIVHAHMTLWNGIPMYLAWKRKIPIRISHSHSAIKLQKLSGKLLLFIQRNAIKLFSTKLCACGDEAAIYLYGKRSFRNERVIVINNAIDANRFKKNQVVRKKVRNEFKISENTFCVGHIGRFHECKNHTFLIKIFKEICNQIPDSKLLLIGDGDIKDRIISEAKENGIFSKVIFAGVRNDPERVYQAMDVFCLPSLFEGFPVVGVEAQAAGLPCVFSDNVSPKVCITQLATMVSLHKSPKEWADIIINLKGYSINSELSNDYDIAFEAKKWEKLYEY